MFLLDLETGNYSMGKKCYCSGPYATIHEEILPVLYWQKETTTAPPHPPNTLLWVSTSLQSIESGKKKIPGYTVIVCLEAAHGHIAFGSC